MIRNPATVAAALVVSVFVPTDERDFKLQSAKKLNAYAKACLNGGYPSRAWEVWNEVLKEYDPDDATARKALGFIQVGSSWAPDPNFEFPSEDEPNAGVARVLTARWDKLAKDLGTGHRKLAQELAASDDEALNALADYHFERTLRFLPSDPLASKARGLKNYEGFVASADKIRLLQRSRMIDREITRVLDKTYEVTELPSSATHPIIDKGGVEYGGVKSEHFVIWGNWGPEVLTEVAMWAERSLEFCTKVFDGYEEFKWPKDPYTMAFFRQRDDWAQVLTENASLMSPARLQFVLANVAAATVGAGKTEIGLAGYEDRASVDDLAVRWVAQRYARLGTDALLEGIGHAVVGLFFGRNLIFSVAREQEESRRTSSGASKKRAPKFTMPDLEIWKELARELAWQGTDIPSGKLMLYRFADFPAEARVKAWSLCDYLLRRDPKLLKLLDRSRQKQRTEPQVNAQFAKLTDGKLLLTDVDRDWRGYWTDDTPLARAVKGEKTPLEAVSAAASKFLTAFNEVRATQTLHLEEVGWSEDYSALCKSHADFLKKHRSEQRSPDRRHTQAKGKSGATAQGRLFAERALISTSAGKPDAVLEEWLEWPGYRDGILSPGLDVVGLYADGKILVMDVARGRLPAGLILTYPMTASGHPRNPTFVPPSVAVTDLGRELEEQLRRRGRRKTKNIGFPMTIHFWREAAFPKSGSLRCRLLKAGKEEVAGFVHAASDGKIRTTSAPGLGVFYPYEPLDKGAEYWMQWFWEDNLGNAQQSGEMRFFVK